MNLESAAHCRDCAGPRVTHEQEPGPPAPRRRRTVGWTFLGLGALEPDDPARGAPPPPRLPGEAELARYYAGQRRRQRWQWLAWAGLALAVVGLLAWQIFRPSR